MEARREDHDHQVIDHAEAYVRGNVHTKGLENFCSPLKRCIKGTYVSVRRSTSPGILMRKCSASTSARTMMAGDSPRCSLA